MRAVDWVLERLERALWAVIDHGFMIICSMILGAVFAWGLLFGLGE